MLFSFRIPNQVWDAIRTTTKMKLGVFVVLKTDSQDRPILNKNDYIVWITRITGINHVTSSCVMTFLRELTFLIETTIHPLFSLNYHAGLLALLQRQVGGEWSVSFYLSSLTRRDWQWKSKKGAP